jgi:hypothetical protein
MFSSIYISIDRGREPSKKKICGIADPVFQRTRRFGLKCSQRTLPFAAAPKRAKGLIPQMSQLLTHPDRLLIPRISSDRLKISRLAWGASRGRPVLHRRARARTFIPIELHTLPPQPCGPTQCVNLPFTAPSTRLFLDASIVPELVPFNEFLFLLRGCNQDQDPDFPTPAPNSGGVSRIFF